MKKNNIFNIFFIISLVLFIYVIQLTEEKKALNDLLLINEVINTNDSFDFNNLVNIRDNIRQANLLVKNVMQENGIPIAENFGSAVIYKKIDNSYYALTNYHVVSKNNYTGNYIMITSFNDEEIVAEVVACDEQYDLAVLKFISDLSYIPVELSTDVVQANDFIMACGNPNKTKDMVTFGNVIDKLVLSNYPDVVVHHNSLVELGSSGGGLYNINGDLIGINTWTSVNDNAYSISIDTILTFLVRNNLL